MKEILLTKNMIALVDDDDFERLSSINWCVKKNRNKYYAINGQIKKRLYMHKLVLDCPIGMMIDHIDGDSLNNQKCNLRLSNYSQNSANRKAWDNKSSKFLGVFKIRKKYQAASRKNGKLHSAGYFETEIDAALAYNELAKKLHGVFAKLNKV